MRSSWACRCCCSRASCSSAAAPAWAPWYYGGLAAGALFCAYQAYLIKERDIVQSFRAFLNNAWFGGAVFAGILLDYTFRP